MLDSKLIGSGSFAHVRMGIKKKKKKKKTKKTKKKKKNREDQNFFLEELSIL